MDWLLYSAVRKKALLTSQIEGAQATLTDLFDEEAGFKASNTDDVAEVSNYIRAFRLVQEQLRDPKGLPISARLLRDARQLSLDGARGAGKQPGELRHSQNWIGGARPGNAVFAPTPPKRLPTAVQPGAVYPRCEGRVACLGQDCAGPCAVRDHPPVLGRQRTHRPSVDCRAAGTPAPAGRAADVPQRLSEEHQTKCYRRLSEIRTEGDWESWASFFLEGVAVSVTQAEQNIIAVAGLIAADRRKLLQSPKAGSAGYRLFELLPMMPRFTVERARQQLQTTFPTANAAVQMLEQLGIVIEVTGQKKNRSYSYQAYVDLLTR